VQVDRLVAAADAVGEMLKYSHQGFLANIRMLRMGGLAAIELAQTIRVAVCVSILLPLVGYYSKLLTLRRATMQVAHQRAGMPLRVKDDGASGRSGVSGSHPFGWRDAMDLLVKWRQLAEPNDQA